MTHKQLITYFKRIDFEGNAQPNLETLQKLQRLHVQHIPFENLNALLKRLVLIDSDSIFQKLVLQNRGGYCFEQNLLFLDVLEYIGFSVKPLAARVLWKKPENAITANSHMLLAVELSDKSYIVDVGFGGQSPTAPLVFEFDKDQPTPHGNYRLVDKSDFILLQTELKAEWKTMYRFTLEPQFQIDYKVRNWYVSTHPDSHFTQVLTVARVGKTGRYTLNNNRFSVYKNNGNTEQRYLSSVLEIKQILEEVFSISLSLTPEEQLILKGLLKAH